MDYSIEGRGRRGELDTASSMELPLGISPVIARRFGPGSGRSYPHEGSTSLGPGYVYEDSEEVRNIGSVVVATAAEQKKPGYL